MHRARGAAVNNRMNSKWITGLVVVVCLGMTAAASAQTTGVCTDDAPFNPCVRGGGSKKTDCMMEWNVTPRPPLDRLGFAKNVLDCHEGDPLCDSDGVADNGSCTFEVAMCINNTDPRLDCDASGMGNIASFEVKSPNPFRLKDVADAANLLMLEGHAASDFGVAVMRKGTVLSAGSVDSTANLCSDTMSLVVPLKVARSGKLLTGRKRISVQMAPVSGRPKENDSLTLICRPSTCGNGKVESKYEECDDGNRIDGDGCDRGCHIEPPTPTPKGSPSATPTITPTPTPTATPVQSPTPSGSPTQTGTATMTPTPTPTHTWTASPTRTETLTKTPTPTHTPTKTPTPTRTWTPTKTPTPTITPTNTRTPTHTPTPTWTPTPTRTPTNTNTPTPTQPPSVVIQSPSNGLFSNAASTTMTGKVINPVPGEVVTVNGTAVTVQGDNTFTASIPLNAAAIFNPILAELTVPATGFATRDRIVVIKGQSIADGSYSPQSIAMRINDSGFDAIEPILPTLVNIDLAALIPPGTTLISNYCAIDGGFLGCLLRVNVVSRYAHIDSFTVNVDAMTGFVAADITLNHIKVDADITGGISCGIELTANAAYIHGNYDLVPLASDPSSIDVNQTGNVSVSFSSFNNQFTSGICDTPVIGDIISLIVGNLESTVSNGLVSYLADPDGTGPQDSPIAAALQSGLAGISITGPIGEAIGVNLESPLYTIIKDSNGITLDSNARITATHLAPGAPDLTASYHVSETFPTFSTTTPVTHQPYDLALCISTSAFNQLLKAEIEGGLLQVEITEIDLGTGPVEINAGVLSLILPELAVYPPNTPMSIRIHPSTAPLLSGSNGPNGEIADLRIAQLIAEIVVNPGNNETVVIRIAGDLRTGLNLTFNNATGALEFGIADPQPSDVNVVVIYNPIHTDEATLQQLLPQLLTSALPLLGDSLGSFPIPSLFGLAPSGVEVSRNGQFMSIFMNL